MTKNFEFLKSKYFPRGGSVKNLGVSRNYLDLLIDGKVPPSKSLLFKAKNAYNINVDDVFSDGVITPSSFQPLLFASESLSFNNSFVSELNRRESVSKDDLAELVGDYYSSMHINGRLSTILMNISNYFIIASTDERLKVHSEKEFNQFAGLRNPFVCLNHEGVDPYVFMHHQKTDDKMVYSVAEEFLPLNIKSIKTDSDSWRKRFSEEGPRDYRRGDDFNMVFVEYKKPISQESLDFLRGEVDKNFLNPDFVNLSKGIGHVLFEEQLSLSKHSFNNRFSEVHRPAMSLEDENVVGFYFYPVQILSHSLNSGAGDNYFPGPATLKLANRFHNYSEGRIKK